MVTGEAEEGAACGAKDNCRGEAEKQTGRVAKIELEATGCSSWTDGADGDNGGASRLDLGAGTGGR